MKYLSHIVATKGLAHGVGRAFQIFSRFLFGTRRFDRMLGSLGGAPYLSDAKITFFVTAILLERHEKSIRRLRELGHVIAAHGLYHSNMKLQTLEKQTSILHDSRQVFEKHGYAVDGFRCPYLSYNEDTIDALRSSQYWWTSQDLICWSDEFPSGGQDDAVMKRLAHIYSWTEADESVSVPRFSKGLVDIPITAPDDEMLVERYKVRDPREIGRIWETILRKTHEKGELCHLLFHPERYSFVRDPLKEVLAVGKEMSPAIWISSLAEIADWWQKRKNSKWTIEKNGNDGWRLWLEAPDEATLLCGRAGARSGKSNPFFRGFAAVDPIEKRDRSAGYFAGNGQRYTVGLSRACPEELEDFLAEEGFFAERTDREADHSFFIDRDRPFEERDRLPLLNRLESADHPLLRLWRWPGEARSALSISSDVDAISILDFVRRALNF